MTTHLSSLPGPAYPVPSEARRAAPDTLRTDASAAGALCSEAEVHRRIDEAVAAEGRRIAHDLHDSVGGLLTAAHLLSSDLAEHLPGADAALAARAARYTADAMEQIRAACHSLADGCDTASALAAVAAEADGVGGTRCSASLAAGVSLPHGASGHDLVLLVREAVGNAMRHARARTITLSVDRAGDAVVVQITDDGAGFSPGLSGGLGCATMEARAQRLGATLSTESALGAGTTVRLVLPLSPTGRFPSPAPPLHV